MIGPAPRRLLTVRLARTGARLSRDYTLSSALHVEDDWNTLGSDSGLGPPPALDTLARLLDATPEEAQRLVEEDTRARVGNLLFQTLFSSAPTFANILRALFARPLGASPDPADELVRVRILTADALLLGLPWRLTTYAGRRLVDLGWTFEVAHEAALRPDAPLPWNRVFVFAEGTSPPERLPSSMLARQSPPGLRNVRLPALGRGSVAGRSLSSPSAERRTAVLIVAPGVAGSVALQTRKHVRELRNALAAMGAAPDDPERYEVVRTRQGLRDALDRLRPEVLYFYGHLDAPAGGARVILAGAKGGADPVAISEVARWLRPSLPLAIYLNGRLKDGGAWSSAALELAPTIPLVVVNRVRSWSEDAAIAGVEWLTACLSPSEDPVAALHAAREPANLYRSTATMHAAYDRWTSEVPEPPPTRMDRTRSRSLDEQRAAAFLHVHRLLHSPRRRVLALLSPAPPTSFGDPGANPFVEEVELGGSEIQRVRCIRVPFFVAPEAELQELKLALLTALGSSETEPLSRTLHDVAAGAPRKPRRERVSPSAELIDPARVDLSSAASPSLVWLDWGTFGAQHRLSYGQIAAWLEIASDVLAPACPPDVRVVCSLAVHVDAEKRAGFVAWLAGRRRGSPGVEFSQALLPQVTALDRDDVHAMIEDAVPDACPSALIEELSTLVFQHAGGDHDATIALVESALATSWSTLRSTLLGAPDESSEEPHEIL